MVTCIVNLIINAILSPVSSQDMYTVELLYMGRHAQQTISPQATKGTQMILSYILNGEFLMAQTTKVTVCIKIAQEEINFSLFSSW